MPDPKPGFTFPGPVPREAPDYFRAKDLRPGFDHRDVWGAEHAHAFTVAKAVQLDILEDVREAVEAALTEGKTFRQFSKELTPVLEKKGWWGEKEQIDPADPEGEPRKVRLGSPRRLRTIYRSNLRAARAAGQWQRIQRTKDSHPYLLYELGPSERHRPQHVAWAGTLLPADDPWWQTHYPPNGWGCKCRVRQVSRREAERRGGVTEPPPYDPVEWTNKRTGDVRKVDRGLDPAWAGNPGIDRARIVMDSLAGKIDAADQDLAQAAIGQVVKSPLLEQHLGPRTGKYPKGDLPIAFLDRKHADVVGSKTQLARMTEYTADKQRSIHPDLTAADYRVLLPRILTRDHAVIRQREYQGVETNNLEFYAYRGGKLYRAVLRLVDDRNLRLATFHRANKSNLKNSIRRGKVVHDSLQK